MASRDSPTISLPSLLAMKKQQQQATCKVLSVVEIIHSNLARPTFPTSRAKIGRFTPTLSHFPKCLTFASSAQTPASFLWRTHLGALCLVKADSARWEGVQINCRS